VRLVNIALAVATTLLAACHNGSNGQRDTTGLPNASAIPTDTTHRDSLRDSLRDRSQEAVASLAAEVDPARRASHAAIAHSGASPSLRSSPEGR
jgi:hypothetical protein